MGYFNYHAVVRRLISEGKLIGHYYTEKHGRISPALVLVFDDERRHLMPIRQERWRQYQDMLFKK